MGRSATIEESGPSDSDTDGIESLDEVAEDPTPPPLPTARPRFPPARGAGGKAALPAADPVGSGGAAGGAAVALARRGALRAAMASRLLSKWAALGRAGEFEAELKRWGDMPLEEPGVLLRQAVEAEDAAGGAAVVVALLARPEGRLAARGSPGAAAGTPLHAAVARQRPAICKLLLEGSADASLTDAAGRTPLALARARRMDASAWLTEDPVVEVLQSFQLKAK